MWILSGLREVGYIWLEEFRILLVIDICFISGLVVKRLCMNRVCWVCNLYRCVNIIGVRRYVFMYVYICVCMGVFVLFLNVRVW